MGVVHRAFDQETQQHVAFKVLHKTEASTVRRFALEATALGKLDHANIVRYFAHGVGDDGSPYLALEWIDGESLRERVTLATEEGQYLPIAEVLELGQRLASALEAAHAAGIVHRDVKPSNILLVEGDLRRPKLVDFGIVRSATAEHDTTAGTVLGTVGYIAPEQARGADDLDGRADLFSLGCVLFRCVTNRDAFHGRDAMTMLSRLLTQKPPRLAELRPDVPHELDVLVARLLANDRELRPASATEVKQALARIDAELLGATQASREPETRPRRPLWIAAITLAVVVLGIAAGLRPWRHTTQAAAANMAAPAGTSLAALPVSPSCTPAAAELYHAAMRSIHEGRWQDGARALGQAQQADGACPEVALRNFVIKNTIPPLRMQRDRLREASRFRNALSTRDRLVLDSFAAMIVEDTPRHDEALRILDRAIQQYPMDAELHLLWALQKLYLARSRDDFEPVFGALRKAAAIDPAYTDAWELQGRMLQNLGRFDEARGLLERCLEASPWAVDCMGSQMYLFQRIGQCTDASAIAKRAASWNSEESDPYKLLAETVAATEAPKAAVEEVLEKRWSHLPPEVRDAERLLDSARLEAWAGHFDAAADFAQRYEQLYLPSSAAREAHLELAELSAQLLFEMGDEARGSLVAEQALVRQDAWLLDSQRPAVNSAPMEAWLLAAAVRGGQRTAAQWRTSAQAWEHANEAVLNASERWVMKWGPAVDARLSPAEALAEMPSAELRDAPRPYLVPWRIGMFDAYVGRIFLQAGDIERALPLLEAGARGCKGYLSPLVRVHAHLWLGMAKEKLGDTTGACTAYGFVVDRWGKATPRSVSAIEAEKRRRALACP